MSVREVTMGKVCKSMSMRMTSRMKLLMQMMRLIMMRSRRRIASSSSSSLVGMMKKVSQSVTSG